MNRAFTIGNIVFGLVLCVIVAGVAYWFSTERKEKAPPSIVMNESRDVTSPKVKVRTSGKLSATEAADAVPIWVSDGEKSFTLMSVPSLLLESVASEDAPLKSDTFTELLAKKYEASVVPGGAGGGWTGSTDAPVASDTAGEDAESWFGGIATLLADASGQMRATVAPLDPKTAASDGKHYYVRIGDSETMLVIDRTARSGTIFEDDIRGMLDTIAVE
jgi:hypothetical protein